MSLVSLSVAGRLFNEKEVSEILKRASSSRTRGELTAADGISLEELQQIGSELGFDPGHIELAAQQLGSGYSTKIGLFNPRIVLDRTVEGEISAEDWLGMVAVIQRYHKASGAITQRGSNYDWAGSEEGGSLALTVNVRNGRSRIRLESNRWLGPIMASIFFPVFALVFSMSLAKHGQPLMALPICLLFGALWFGLLRVFHQNHVLLVSGLIERLADEVPPQDLAHPLETSNLVGSETAISKQSVQS